MKKRRRYRGIARWLATFQVSQGLCPREEILCPKSMKDCSCAAAIECWMAWAQGIEESNRIEGRRG